MIRLILSILVLPLCVIAQPLRWTTYTSTSNVKDLTATSDHIWAVTTGGLAGLDPATGTFDVYTNTRGLAMNNSLAGGRDARGWVWIAHQNGMITRVDPQTGATRSIDGLRGEVFEITSILDVGDEVFVAANNGIYRFSYRSVGDNYRILESIRDLGQLPGETRVADLVVTGDYLYAATALGLARALYSQQNLSAPDSWETFTTGNSTLPENDLRSLYSAADGTLWVASENFIVRFDGSTFTPVSASPGVVAFAELENELYAVRKVITEGFSEVLRMTESGVVRVGQTFITLNDLAVYPATSGSELVLAVGDSWQGRGGLSFLQGDQWSSPIHAAGIGSNLISEVKVDRQGRLWGGGADHTGVFVLDGDVARNYNLSLEYPYWYLGYMPNSFAFDNYGGAWAGSEGGGVMWFHGDTLTRFNHFDSTGFDANGPRLTYTVPDYLVAGVARNAAGDIFITNSLSQNNKPLARVLNSWIALGNHSEPWIYQTAVMNSMNPAHRDVIKMIEDPFHRLWIGGHDRNGSADWVFDDRGTATDTSDDQWFEYVPSELADVATCFDELITGVTSWDIDQQGYLWVAAHNGAYYTQAGIPGDLNALHFVCVYDLPVGQSVNAIHVDAQDNKWFGTDDGVAVMDRNFTWVHVFKTADADEHRSGLASNSVTSITSNPATGDIWIGTADGLSRLQSPYVSRGEGLNVVVPYPNPFTADGSHHMFVDHTRLGGSFDMLRVFTLSGRLVRELRWSQAIDPNVGWDGRNDDGDLVAGGVYLLVVSASNGNSATGKVAVLGK